MCSDEPQLDWYSRGIAPDRQGLLSGIEAFRPFAHGRLAQELCRFTDFTGSWTMTSTPRKPYSGSSSPSARTVPPYANSFGEAEVTTVADILRQ